MSPCNSDTPESYVAWAFPSFSSYVLVVEYMSANNSHRQKDYF